MIPARDLGVPSSQPLRVKWKVVGAEIQASDMKNSFDVEPSLFLPQL